MRIKSAWAAEICIHDLRVFLTISDGTFIVHTGGYSLRFLKASLASSRHDGLSSGITLENRICFRRVSCALALPSAEVSRDSRNFIVAANSWTRLLIVGPVSFEIRPLQFAFAGWISDVAFGPLSFRLSP